MSNSNSFNFLQKYLILKGEKGVPFRNGFYPVEERDIERNEKRLGFKFPSELRQFFLEIGCGFFKSDHRGHGQNTYSNRLLGPESIADILLEGVDSGQLHPDTDFMEGEMPFFEIADSASFLVMFPKSNNPNTVYNMVGKVVEESFSKFIWRLYYESSTFYLNV